MFLEYARLKGYIGLKRGSDVDEIEIPFYKMKSRICFIIGNNGSGKSTLRKALNPLIDSADNFLPNVEGEKELRYRLNDGTIVNIFIFHGFKPNGERASAKAYIKKIVDGEEINLNPNGNIGSYKEVIEDIFDLDPNFLLLTSLGTDNKGIASNGITPTERKKVIASKISSVEVYNDIGRAVTKRASTRKAIINSITAKIDTIGDEESLHSRIKNNEYLIDKYVMEKERLQSEKSKFELLVDQLDPDKCIINKYNDLIDRLNRAKTEYNSLFVKEQNLTTHDIELAIESANNTLSVLNNEKINKEKEMYGIDSTLPKMLAEHEETARLIQLKTERLNSLGNETNFEDIKEMYETTKNDIAEYERIFKENGITNPLSISKDEYIIGLNTIKEIKESLDSINYYISDENLSKTLEYVSNGSFPSSKKISDEIDSLKKSIQDNNMSINNYKNDISRLDILKHRPSNCGIDDCYFINEAVRIKATNPEEKMNKLIEDNEEMSNRISSLSSEIEDIELMCTTIQYLQIVKRNIDRNYSILIKLPHGESFTDLNFFTVDLLHGRIYEKMITDVYNTITFANIFDKYRDAKELFASLENEMKLYDSKITIIQEVENDLLELKEKSDEMIHELDSIYNKKQMIRHDLDNVVSEYDKTVKIIERLEIVKSKLIEIDDIKSQILLAEEDSDKIKKLIIDINNINSSIIGIDNQLAPLRNTNGELNYSLKMLTEYKEELKTHLASINVLEVVKKHSTPKTGIQLVFMKMYFGKILTMANELLVNFFGGNLTLSDYFIDENIFKISCYDARSGLTNDDISSCSTSETCMIGMVLSYAFMRQGSSIYDIFQLDEVDAGLDSDNRMSFIPSINHLMDVLGLQQCIMISHSSETDISTADAILLRQPARVLSTCNANVILSV